MRASTKKKHGMGKRFAVVIGVAAVGVMALVAQTGAQTQAPTPPGQAPPTCNDIAATIVGTKGSDSLKGTRGPDSIVGLGGNDTIAGLAGRDMICGGHGDDTLKGGKADDYLVGGHGNDTLNGGPGRMDYCPGSSRLGHETPGGGPRGPHFDTSSECEGHH